MDPSVVIGQTTEMRKKKDLPSFFSHIHPVPPGSLAYKYGVDSFLSFFLSTMFLQHWSSKNRKARQSSLPLTVENDRTPTDASIAAPIDALPGRDSETYEVPSPDFSKCLSDRYKFSPHSTTHLCEIC